MKYFPLSIFTPDELYTATGRVDLAIGTDLDSDAFVAAVLPRVRQNNALLARALGRDLSSEFTSVLAEKDSGRDNAFIGFRDYVGAFIYNPDVAKAQAAQLLVNLIEKHGWAMQRAGYAAETTQLSLLFADLAAENAQQALTAIGASEWLANLQTAQADFETTYQAKVATEAGVQQPLVTESRRLLTRYLGALLSYIDIQSEFNSALFGPVADRIDEVNTDMVTVARARRTRQGGNSEPAPETPVE